jgi:beta-lactam-binding protein with PASTA domain
MPLTARVWSLGKLLLLAGALVATFFGFALIGMRVALRAREVQVPDLVGTPVDRATQIAADLGLGLRVDPNPRPDDRVPAGQLGSAIHADANPRGAERTSRTPARG